MNKISLKKISDFMYDRLSDDEVQQLCFDYFPDVYENLNVRGLRKKERIRDILDYVGRGNRLKHLLGALYKEFTDLLAIDFPEGFDFDITPHHTSTKEYKRSANQIFISYANQDSEFARLLADELEIRGWSVWIAPDSIAVGEQWAEAIERGLSTSIAFLLVMSPSSVQSRWVKKETNSAMILETEGQVTVIPLLLQACKVPLFLRGYQHISFTRNSYPIDDLVKRLEKIRDPLSFTTNLTDLLLQPDYKERLVEQTEKSSLDAVKEQLNNIIIDISQAPLVKLRAVESLLHLSDEGLNWDLILIQPEMTFIRHLIELITDNPKVNLNETQAKILLERKDLPRHGNCVAVPIKQSIERTKQYTSSVFHVACDQKPWEIRLDCITRIIEINDDDSLPVLLLFLQKTTYWVARIRVVRYIEKIFDTGEMNKSKRNIACQILEYILSDGHTSSNSKTGLLARTVQEKIQCKNR